MRYSSDSLVDDSLIIDSQPPLENLYVPDLAASIECGRAATLLHRKKYRHRPFHAWSYRADDDIAVTRCTEGHQPPFDYAKSGTRRPIYLSSRTVRCIHTLHRLQIGDVVLLLGMIFLLRRLIYSNEVMRMVLV